MFLRHLAAKRLWRFDAVASAFVFGTLLLSTFYLLLPTNLAFAQTCAVGQPCAAINTNSMRNISIGTSTPTSETKVLIVASSTGSTEFTLKVLQPSTAPIFLVRNDGSIMIGTSTPGGAQFYVQGNIANSGNFQTVGNFQGNIIASYVTGGNFGNGSGNFSFPASLGVNTTTQATLPANLSVYGTSWYSATSTFLGNVGIGTTAPATTLNVVQNGAISVGDAYLSSGGANFAHLASNAYYNGSAWTIPNAARTSALLQFNDNVVNFWYTTTAGSASLVQSMTINGSGNVGIGTTQPSSTLHVVGGGIFTGNVTSSDFTATSLTSKNCIGTDSSGNFITGTCGGSLTGAGTAKNIAIWTGGSSLGNSILSQDTASTTVLVPSGGLAVGTTAAQSAGVIYATGNIQTAGNFQGNIVATYVTGGNFGNGSGNFSFPANLGVNTTTQATLPANLAVYGTSWYSATSTFLGSVGIGTTGPNAPLDVFKTQSGETDLYVENRNTTAANTQTGIVFAGYRDVNNPWPLAKIQVQSLTSGVGELAQNGEMRFYTGGYDYSGLVQRMVIQAGGNVGIGTATPNAPLSFGTALGNKIFLYDGANSSYGFGIQSSLLQIFSGSAVADIAFGYGSSTSMTELMRVKGNGNVGIGTTQPSSTLHVVGGGTFTGNVTSSDFTVTSLKSQNCIGTDSSGNFITGSCGGSLTGAGTANYLAYWTGAANLATSTFYQNGTTVGTTGGLAVGTTAAQSAGVIYATGNIQTAGNFQGNIVATYVTGGNFGNGSGNFSFPANLGVNTTTQATLPANLSVYGTSWYSATSTFLGNVGIGTTGPLGQLDVESMHGANVGGINFIAKDTVTANSYPLVYSYKTGATNGASALLGFNTYVSAAGTGAQLVNPNSGGWEIASDNRNNISSPDLYFASVNSSTPGTSLTVLDLQANGNVSIGTAANSTRVQMNGAGGTNAIAEYYSTEANPRWLLGRDAGGSGMAALQFGPGGATAPDTTIARLSGAAGISIMGGNVGIGTTTAPYQKFEVAGSGIFGANTLDPSPYSNGLTVESATGAAVSLFLSQPNIGSAQIGMRANDSNLYILNSYTTGLISNSPGIAINTSGNVGIGTTGPGQKLEVVGNVSSTGLLVNGNATTTNLSITSLTSKNCLGTNAQGLVQTGTCGGTGTVTSITAGTGLSGGTVTSTGTFAVNYGSSANQAAMGNVNITGPSAGAGLSGTGNAIAVGAGGTFNAISLDLTHANTWTAAQTFNVTTTHSGAATFPSSGIWNSAGQVGIGTTGPAYPLSLGSGLNSTKLAVYETGSTNFYGLGTISSGALTFGAGIAASGTPQMVLLYPGNVGIGTTTPTYKLEVVSGGGTTARFGTASGDTIVVGGGSGKITVGTEDPIYTIGGQRYATYGGENTGVKVDTTGVAHVTCNTQYAACSTVLDFKNAEKGSDLWLFYQTTDFGSNMENLSVLLTPSFDGRVWYEKDGKNLLLKIFAATSDKQQATSLEVSYRLTAPRFDSAKWPNTSLDSSAGFVIEQK